MNLDDILRNFLSLTQDAVAVGYRPASETVARLVYVNEGYCAQFVYRPEDVLGRSAVVNHDPTEWDAFTQSIAPDIEAGTPQFHAECSCIRADGSTFWASISIILCEIDEQGGRYSIAIYRDISDLKRRENTAVDALSERDRLLTEQEAIYQQLHESQSRLVAAIDAHSDPFVIYDADLRLVTCNTAYRTNMSSDPDTIQPGMHVGDVLYNAIDCGRIPEPPQGRKKFVDDIVENTYKGGAVEDLEFVGDVHHRVIRSRAKTGDYISLRLDITELVRERRRAEEASSRLTAALNAYPYPFVIFDKDGLLVTCNTAYAESMVKTPDQIKPGMSFRDVLNLSIDDGMIAEPPEGRQKYFDDMEHSARSELPQEDLELAGDIHHRVMRHISASGDYIVLRVDITELVRQRRRLEAAQKRLLSAMNAYPGPFCIYDADYRLVNFNRQYALSITNVPRDVKIGMTLEEVMLVGLRAGTFEDGIGREEEWLHGMMARATSTQPQEDIPLRGDIHHRLFRSRSDSGDLIMVRIDMTEQVRQRRALQEYAERLELANSEITFKAHHDELTGLGNRRYLSEKFEELSRYRAENGGELTALHMDLDRFKQINDTIGHAAGDHVLEVVAERIREHTKTGDIVARIGGDEFVVLIWEADPTDRPQQLARGLIGEMFKPTVFEGRECRFGASIGLARTPLADEDGLLTYSDIALYKAKRAGRGQLAVFDTFDIDEMRATKALADDIMRALEHSEFVPHYQPQIDARTGRVAGVEALARWYHPEKGVLLPGSFLAVAEDLNVVAEIDKMIFEKAIVECEDAFSGMGVFPSLSFNVSTNRITEHGFEDIAHRVAAYSGEVSFELLETIYLEEEDNSFMMQLDRLRELGISIEVDDFGSGRASVVALQKIAPERLKIDGRLILPVVESQNSARLVQSIIEIGNALEIGVIAEGVATAEHAQILTELGADRLQGFYFSKPLPISRLIGYLSRTEKRISNG